MVGVMLHNVYNAIVNNAEVFDPLILKNLDNTEEAIVRAIFAPYVPEQVTATFNAWIITKISQWYFVRRETWDQGGYTPDSLDRLKLTIDAYYSPVYDDDGNATLSG